MAVCGRSLFSIFILCTCIINSRALKPQTKRLTPVGKSKILDNRLANDCKHLFLDSQRETSTDIEGLSSDINDFSMMKERMLIQEGDFNREKSTLNATGLKSPVHSFTSQVSSVSRTGFKGVYLVSVSISLLVTTMFSYVKPSTDSPHTKRTRFGNSGSMEIASEFEALFSNQTGQLCATFCAGKPPPDQEGSTLDHLRHSYAPAEFVFNSAHQNLLNNDTSAFVKWDCDVHIELQYPRSNTIATPIVAGVMNSLRNSNDVSFFHTIHIYGLSAAHYEYTPSVFEQAKNWGDVAKEDMTPENELRAWYLYPPFCPWRDVRIIRMPVVFDSTCNSTESNHCSPFRNIRRRVQQGPGASPVTVHISRLQCTEGPDWRINAKFIFTDSASLLGFGETDAQDDQPHTDRLTESMHILVAEGYWSMSNQGQLVMVAYYPSSNGTVVDTKIQITLQLPTIRTIYHRYGVVGHIRSMREANDALYFKPIGLLGKPVLRLDRYNQKSTTLRSMFQVEYRYDARVAARIEPMCSVYANKDFRKHAQFPDGSSASDFEVPFVQISSSLVSSENSSENLYVSFLPFAIRDQVQQRRRHHSKEDAVRPPYDARPLDTEIPMSFAVMLPEYYQRKRDSLGMFRGLRTAEGRYDSKTGHLCMLGCVQSPDSKAISYYEEGQYAGGNNSVATERCDVFFSIQYPPTNPRLWAKRPFVTGNITSLLDATHPLYFNPLILNGTLPRPFYREQAVWSVLRRNLETMLSLGSLSLTALFAGIQVWYSGKESSFKNLRYMSLVMLIILVSGDLFPLLFSFKAMWIRSRSMLYETRLYVNEIQKWSNAYEVIARGTSIAALLLQLRLVQLVLKARSRARQTLISLHGSDRALNAKINADTVVLLACLPLYVAVMAVVAIVHWHGASPLQQSTHYVRNNSVLRMMWADIVAFSGVILDLFLVPQVIANALWNTKDKVAPFHPVFYIGMTVVSSTAHLFDAGRVMKFIPEGSSQYFYANPDWDLYSTTWDILIPCGSILLAMLLFLQQKYGGRCFIPKCSTPKISYEQVPNVDL